jgi:hypothetical protein
MRFEGQAAVNIKITVFWDVMTYNVPVFWKNLLLSSSGGPGSSKMLVNFYETNIVPGPRRLES